MQGHNNDVRRLVCTGIASDSFAQHFAQHFNDTVALSEIKRLCEFSVYWCGDPLVTSKRFGTRSCALCDRERVAIADGLLKGKRLINKNTDFYAGCRHKSKFLNFFTEELAV